MRRSDFEKIIKIRSIWKIDKRKGDYTLADGSKLSRYVRGLIISQMRLDNLGIRSNGDLCHASGGSWSTEQNKFDDILLYPPFENNETCTYENMETRITRLVHDLLY